VDVALSDGESLRAEYLAGCDGGRSLGRKAAGIEFPGWDPTTSALIAEVEMAEEPELGIRHDDLGVHSPGRLEYEVRDGEVVYMDGGAVRVMVTEGHVGPTTEPTCAISARRSSRSTGPITGSTVPPGSLGSPI
jgi:2-polyprenyl-6-methoxyphenol hydroxylase-like FAD-dependent oxidoreductase